MREDTHKQAEHLLLKAAVDQLTSAESSWLRQHLEDCAACTQVSGRLEEVMRSLRSVSVAADPSLVEITRQRVRERARRLSPRRASASLLWISCVLTWSWTVLSAPYIWRGCAWIGKSIGAPDWAWQMTFGLWWLLPALVVAATLTLHTSARAASEEGYAES